MDEEIGTPAAASACWADVPSSSIRSRDVARSGRKPPSTDARACSYAAATRAGKRGRETAQLHQVGHLVRQGGQGPGGGVALRLGGLADRGVRRREQRRGDEDEGGPDEHVMPSADQVATLRGISM
jgi:hypothetical protein